MISLGALKQSGQIQQNLINLWRFVTGVQYPRTYIVHFPSQQSSTGQVSESKCQVQSKRDIITAFGRFRKKYNQSTKQHLPQVFEQTTNDWIQKEGCKDKKSHCWNSSYIARDFHLVKNFWKPIKEGRIHLPKVGILEYRLPDVVQSFVNKHCRKIRTLRSSFR